MTTPTSTAQKVYAEVIAAFPKKDIVVKVYAEVIAPLPVGTTATRVQQMLVT